MKKRISLLLVFIMIITLNSCGKDGSSSESSVAVTEATVNQVILDYGDEQAFEAALNNGDDLVGKTVVFKAGEIHPDSKLGYNIWSGEHLNFVSKDDPGIKVGDSVAVRITKVENMFTDSWVLNYEKVENAVSGDSTIHYDTMKGKATEKERFRRKAPETFRDLSSPESLVCVLVRRTRTRISLYGTPSPLATSRAMISD